jgi:uncharacterized membrane protein
MESSSRLKSIDAVRGLAVVLMLLHHFTEYLMFNALNSAIFIIIFVVTRLSAPLFLVVTGISMILSADRRAERQKSGEISAHFLKRGVLLIAAGFAINIIIMDFTSLNILYTLGLSSILFSSLIVKPNQWNNFRSLVVILLITGAVYTSKNFENVFSSFDFPLFPWIIFVAYGIILGTGITAYKKTEKKQLLVGYLETSAILLIITTAIFVSLKLPFVYRHTASLPFITFSMSIITYVLSAAIQLYEFQKKNPFVGKPLEILGRHALQVYFISFVVVVTIPKICGFEKRMSEAGALFSMALFLGCALWILSYAEGRKRTSL